MTFLDLSAVDRLEQHILDDLINALKWGKNSIESIKIPGRIDTYRAARIVEILNNPSMNLASLSLSKSSFSQPEIEWLDRLFQENRVAERRLRWL
ncbi:hypothetical protein GWC77_27540 [Paraburkholderia sp. NMBU_R16]|uniref:hypothetical protein n=1 Tax=Paraburkholderia sp. NMBU_R16 TaxID=2698676 RepID=UPI0015659E18|nr:hypothetical protein [Paraburkholderia sp. NMBU_R16]NRO99611.1 hypothetical protein [Paraburkholderia sp. NMBU_R16]